MPRKSSIFPPTPAASTDITGKPSTNVLQFDSSFTLPPAALGSNKDSASPSASHNTDSSYRPLSPTSPTAPAANAPTLRKRAPKAQAVVTQDDYSLPPPPLRPRKIIQMDPQKMQQSKIAVASGKDAPATGGNSKRKQAGAATTAQGRKIARKTAHSLIERRRRSKMNEEFAVLKEMIPGCQGQDMHKLSILQASIEYMRYLEKCVADLKTVRSRDDIAEPLSPEGRPVGGFVPEDAGEDDNDEDDNDDNDKDMEDAEDDASTQPSPNICPSDQALHSCTTSPNIFAQVDNSAIHTAIHRQPDPRRFSLASSIPSTTTSPSIHPLNQASSHSNRHYSFSTVPSTVPSSALTSPALGPQRQQEDQEATEALLMLNSADRRSWSDLGKRGMSVKDLLSG